MMSQGKPVYSIRLWKVGKPGENNTDAVRKFQSKLNRLKRQAAYNPEAVIDVVHGPDISVEVIDAKTNTDEVRQA